MFNATEVERKIREINLLIVQNFRLLFPAVSPAIAWDSQGAKNVSSTHVQNFWKVNKSW